MILGIEAVLMNCDSAAVATIYRNTHCDDGVCTQDQLSPRSVTFMHADAPTGIPLYAQTEAVAYELSI